MPAPAHAEPYDEVDIGHPAKKLDLTSPVGCKASGSNEPDNATHSISIPNSEKHEVKGETGVKKEEKVYRRHIVKGLEIALKERDRLGQKFYSFSRIDGVRYYHTGPIFEAIDGTLAAHTDRVFVAKIDLGGTGNIYDVACKMGYDLEGFQRLEEEAEFYHKELQNLQTDIVPYYFGLFCTTVPRPGTKRGTMPVACMVLLHVGTPLTRCFEDLDNDAK